MNTRILVLFCLLITVLLITGLAEAQQPKKIPRIGYLAGNREGPSVEEFQRGLRDRGYVVGKNILVEYRYTEGKADRTPSLWLTLYNSRSTYWSSQAY